jgi:hypothetical protein
VATLVASLLVTASSLGSNPDIPPKHKLATQVKEWLKKNIPKKTQIKKTTIQCTAAYIQFYR